MNNMKKFYFNVIITVGIVGITYTSLIHYYASPGISMAVTVALIILMGVLVYLSAKHSKDTKDYLNRLELGVAAATSREIMMTLPFPIVMFKQNGGLDWSNTDFRTEFPDVDNISDIISQADIAYMISQGESKEIEIYNRRYDTVLRRINDVENGNYYIVYFFNKNDYYDLLRKYEEEQKVISLIFIDNYYEIMESLEAEKEAALFVEIDKQLNKLAGDINGVIKKYDRDKYIFIFDSKYLDDFKENKFAILDSIRGINTFSEIPVTISIGVGEGGKNLKDNYANSRSAIELALGRGGDHAVVKNGDKIVFYGGKTKEVEKRSKVRARIIAQALNEMVKQSDRVVIMGHKMPDMDCVGSAIGLSRGIKALDKPVNIVLNSITPSIELLMKKLDSSDEFDNIFIKSDEAIDIATENTLVIVTDTHRPDSVECEELLKTQERIVMVDHHRRGKNFIEDTIITYLEPYASSTCELVTEMLQYITQDIKLLPEEADALLAGITVDTKNFCFKTGVRTFEAASYLRKHGASGTEVRQLFQNDLDIFLERYNIVKNAQVFNNDIAIATCNLVGDNSSLVVAQAADELLTIQGIKASFVLCDTNQTILISGRSFGDINVQVILEQLGGGGHFTVAGAQLKDITLEEALEKLEEAIVNIKEEMNSKQE